MPDFTYDISTNIGKIRALIMDTDASNYLLTDSQISLFLTLNDNDLFLTAYQALNTIAASKALVAKMKKAGNYQEDLTKIAAEIRAAAKEFKDMATNTPAEAQAEIITSDFSYREILRNKALRDESLDE